MREILDEIEAWSRRGERIAIATVVATKRSAPRPPGAKLAVNERGEVAGAVSGGCVDGAVAAAARDVLAAGEPRLLHFGIADAEAWDVGLPCGGEIEVFVAEYSGVSDPVTPQAAFARLARGGGRGGACHRDQLPRLAAAGDQAPRSS